MCVLSTIYMYIYIADDIYVGEIPQSVAPQFVSVRFSWCHDGLTMPSIYHV